MGVIDLFTPYRDGTNFQYHIDLTRDNPEHGAPGQRHCITVRTPSLPSHPSHPFPQPQPEEEKQQQKQGQEEKPSS